VVPASKWAFARLGRDGELFGLLADAERKDGELTTLKSELSLQRAQVKTGARIASMLGPLGNFQSGVTLLFADAQANFGILTLMRTAELGAFTSTEVSMLTLALDASSERLSALRLYPSEAHSRALAREAGDRAAIPKDGDTSSASYVLDSDLHIVLAWSGEDRRRVAITDATTRLDDRLPAVLEETVRELVSGWQDDPGSRGAGAARPVPFLVVRTQPMSGPTGLFIGVRIERSEAANSLAGPAARYHISPRELQVLALLLDGAKLEDIGRQLFITSSTVQDHIKSMVEKTGSRNRTELIARVLGWQSGAQANEEN
jgi:DNA-binding CsgD family transcriptional regulator